MIEFLGADSGDGLYIQYRVFRYSKGANIPVGTFWSDKAPKMIRNDRVYYYSPGLRNYGKNQVLGSFVAWLDFDDLEDWQTIKYHLLPSRVVFTGGGYHVYWRMDEFIDYDTLGSLLKRLRSMYPTADPMCIDATRFLRFPGSYNLKYDPPRMCKTVYRSPYVYSARKVWGNE